MQSSNNDDFKKVSKTFSEFDKTFLRQTRIPNERDKVREALKNLDKAMVSTDDPYPTRIMVPLDDLVQFVMEQKNADYYRGCRTHPEAKALLDRFKQAAEAKITEQDISSQETEDRQLYGWNYAISEATAALRSVSMEDLRGE